jgi:hypothetical protein
MTSWKESHDESADTYLLTRWSRILHEKMVVVKKIPPLMGSEGSLPVEEHRQITKG